MIPSKTFAQKGERCTGGKMSKDRLSVFLCANMDGEFEKPVVIGKSENPRSFKNLDRSTLPVIWKFNKKAWMLSRIMTEWLNRFNTKMKIQQRKVLLFLDNASCHPHIELSNVRLVFFPANTTSVLQPMDQGVINCFKCWYKKFVLRKLLSKMDECSNVSELASAITPRDAIFWIARACRQIPAETVKKCFLKSGFSSATVGPVEDLNLETDREITQLCEEARLEINAETFISYDDVLMTEDLNLNVDEQQQSDGESDCESGKEDSEKCKITTIPEAISCLDDLDDFAAFKNSPQLIEYISKD